MHDGKRSLLDLMAYNRVTLDHLSLCCAVPTYDCPPCKYTPISTSEPIRTSVSTQRPGVPSESLDNHHEIKPSGNAISTSSSFLLSLIFLFLLLIVI